MGVVFMLLGRIPDCGHLMKEIESGKFAKEWARVQRRGMKNLGSLKSNYFIELLPLYFLILKLNTTPSKYMKISVSVLEFTQKKSLFLIVLKLAYLTCIYYNTKVENLEYNRD